LKRSLGWSAFASLTIALTMVLQPSLTGTTAAATAHRSGQTVRAAQSSGSLSADEVQRLAADATQHVILLLRDQHGDLLARGVTRTQRVAAVAGDQRPILDELARLNAPRVRSFHVVNAIAATVSAAEEARLAQNPAVRAVVPDLTLHEPRGATLASQLSAPGVSPQAATCPQSGTTSLEPEALQLTNDAFTSSVPQAQNIVTGTGVTVAYIAEGIDINSPEFIRPNGQRVFSDYKDFTGDGPLPAESGNEAALDASSIAAQGNEFYNLNDYVASAHRQPQCFYFKVLGMAPGVSLVGLRAFGNNSSPTSNFVQAIEYAVDHGVNVLNESFGSNPYPDPENDPIALADDAAVAAGVTVVASSGDAGTEHTIGSPATDPNVISVGGTTQFRLYSQVVAYGFQLATGGYLGNNISGLSSAGPAQSAQQTVDVVAPGDLGWAVAGNPAHAFISGGTSESAPLVSGEAALIIQAYRQTHNGVSPTPALIKQIVTSTATDLNIPAYEQGAGLINALKAVQVAQAISDTNVTSATAITPTNALLVQPGKPRAATDLPGTPEQLPFQITNESTATDSITPTLQTLGIPTSNQSFSVALAPTTTVSNTGTFIDQSGRSRVYSEQDVTVPAADRLDASISFDVTNQPFTLVRLVLIDPAGRYVGFSQPQDGGPPVRESGYGHVDVHDALAGVYRAIVFTAHSTAGYSGTVRLAVSTSNFAPAGTVSGPATLAPGATGTYVVSTTTPLQPGDESAQVAISGTGAVSGTAPTTVTAGAIPVILRSLIRFPLAPAPAGTVFSGTLTGGEGRGDSPAQTLTYAFTVPTGLKDLDLGLSITDTNYNLEGILSGPNSQPLDRQSTITALDSKGQPSQFTNALQFFRRDPAPGRYQFVLVVNDSISGLQPSIPFSATLRYNGVSVQAPGVPTSTSTQEPSGQPITIPVTVTNTGAAAKDFFVDPRLTQYASLLVANQNVSVPLSGSFPQFYVPTEANQLSVVAEAMSSTNPISMDILNVNGAPPFGNPKPESQETGAPDIQATSFVDPGTGNAAAVASLLAAEVPFGYWKAAPTLVGPYAQTVTPITVSINAAVSAQQFDTTARPSSGDGIRYGLNGFSGSGYAPLTLAPGQSGVITVTIVPTGTAGMTVTGNLYVDAFNVNSGAIGSVTGSGDELQAIPYAYQVSPPAATMTPTQPTGTMTTTATSTGTMNATATATGTVNATTTATGTVNATTTATGTVNATTTAVASPSSTVTTAPSATGTATTSPTNTATASPSATNTATASPSATNTATASPTNTATNTATNSPTNTATNSPTNTATNTPVPAPSTSTAIPSTSTATSILPTAVPATATGFPTIIPISTPTNTAATATATATPQPRPMARPCLVRTLFLYGSRFSFDGFTFDTLPNISARNLRGTGGRHPRVTSPAPLFFDNGRTAFYSDTRYRSLACGGTTLVDVTGTVFIGYTPGQHGRLVDLTGRTFRLRVRAARNGYSALLEIYGARVNPRTYNSLHGTVSVSRWFTANS